MTMPISSVSKDPETLTFTHHDLVVGGRAEYFLTGQNGEKTAPGRAPPSSPASRPWSRQLRVWNKASAQQRLNSTHY